MQHRRSVNKRYMSVINPLYTGKPLISTFANSEDPGGEDPGEMKAQCMNMFSPPPPKTLKPYWSWKLITFVNEIHNPNKNQTKVK